MKKKALVTDADNVLFRWFANIAKYNKENNLPYKHIEDVTSGNPFVGVEQLFPTESFEESYSHLAKYNISKHGATLPVFEKGSEEILKDISEEFKIIVVTNFGECEISHNNRTMNLHNVYGDIFTEIHCLGTETCKRDVLADIRSRYDVAMWVDDHLKNVKKGLEAGIPESYQYTHQMVCGRNTGEVSEVNSWATIKDKLFNL